MSTFRKTGRYLAGSGSLVVLFVLALLLTACQSDIDKNSTAASLLVRPASAIETATPSGNSAAPTATPAPTKAATTAASGNATTAAGGATTTAAGGTATTAATVKGDATAGAKTFKQQCQSCHSNGGKAVGPAGQPNLSISPNAGDVAYITGNIRNGRNAMPAIDKDTLSDEEMNNVIAYVLSIRTK